MDRLEALRVACDVDNPLYGPRGAARVFGPQKASNGARVRETTAALHERFQGKPPADGEAVLAAFSELTGARFP